MNQTWTDLIGRFDLDGLSIGTDLGTGRLSQEIEQNIFYESQEHNFEKNFIEIEIFTLEMK